ncbi:alpha/beta hydrolase [Rhodococcus kronopolitis]|uniref:Alpha/beta hydrolase n=1 Tax=Rhodococcus kronopolitis TaxID=1460226 RepID=A0ABV9FUI6_9NOCA
MPFYDGASGQVHYRHWPCAEPLAGLVLLHGRGQHSGNYHRFARALGAERIEVWALDHVGHGLSEGELGDYGPVPDLGVNVVRLAEIARAERPGAVLAVMGHSLGAVAAITALTEHPDLFEAVVLSGLPRYAATEPELLAQVRAPILAVHGVDDRLAPVDGTREWAARLQGVELWEYADAGHDLLHEPVAGRVTADVTDFLLRSTVGR